MPQIMIFSYYVPAAWEAAQAAWAAAPAAARRTTAFPTWLRRASSASGSFTLHFFFVLGKDDAFESACAASNFQLQFTASACHARTYSTIEVIFSALRP
jgi:hypothetical protein